ncbi:aldehyde dehydrogenase family protein [Mycobacterium vicinigordonae]|uniref:aldehyde dehydrogenase (NAD(+)) n=1 Tax=Mycobacterium vicinigordonae TaxID=1719132 RepID=A0A7D6E4A9_9MYCO|nr:aldehyde dehydrogenase family protein [Mycobacterium vicinigordonae]QLL08726.1 aldehyde dehydrogenase family protein [Mycobacterium vicinigordonae]
METCDRPNLFIGGRWVPAGNEPPIDVINPATEEVIGRVPNGGPDHVNAAVSAARAAWESWADTPVEDRAKICERVGKAWDALIPEIAQLISREVGTPVVASETLQAPGPSIMFRHYAAIARSYPWTTDVNGSIVVREPIGVVGAITPWNYPLTLVSYKIPGALAAGCTVVLKPSEVAPLSAFVLAEQLQQAGLPDGVFNIVTGGPAAGERLVSHPEVDMVTFTGSTASGRHVAAAAAATVKRVHLELGGKSAAIFMPDTDLDEAVGAYLRQALMNNGQTCLAWSRLLVPADRHDEIVEALKVVVESAFAPGDPFGGAFVGPMASKVQQRRIQQFIRQGQHEGAVLVTGGADSPQGLETGFYLRPTIFANVSNDMTVAREEIFGPVICVLPYRDVDEAVAIANDSPYGLHGAVFSADADAAIALARRLRTGQVDINGFQFNVMAPFGGYKQSGNGKELGVEGFEAFLETKTIQHGVTT